VDQKLSFFFAQNTKPQSSDWGFFIVTCLSLTISDLTSHQQSHILGLCEDVCRLYRSDRGVKKGQIRRICHESVTRLQEGKGNQLLMKRVLDYVSFGSGMKHRIPRKSLIF
jgi:hypothetical protein